ncbi:Hypothetical protein R9X50_00202600 [Acrodontium crateriforme]|uniref:Amino acid transporter transmembrane domain-containing protein n=1 Tax=Acrodontium crateriforme TaxID=150365 RepID=A0AAQ3M3G5_9PEZI|nr:Hypothetical protein R9X50_00202600 [Acrodontium crateriforme]
MAIGFGRKTTTNTPAINQQPLSSTDQDAAFGDKSYYNGFGSGDDENQGTTRGPRKMSRIDKPVTKSISGAGGAGTSDDDDMSISVGKQMELEAGNAIKYRTCSWQKTAALLFSEYICLAIMSFPYSYSVLGLIPGLILTVVIAGLVLYTSLTVWEFCLRHPEVKDVCDIGQMLFWNQKWAWWFTAVMFLLNNTFIQGFHCLVGSKYLNTMTDGAVCTIVFSIVVAIVSFFCSLPRTFSTLAKLATLSALFTFISVLLAAIFAAVEKEPPRGYDPKDPIALYLIPQKGTTFADGMNAFMNISYTFIGQITLPSFIAEMKEPRDFPKALWAVTIAEVILFSLVGAIIVAYTGSNYYTAPAFGSLGNTLYLKVSFSFMIPTLIFLGVLYASVSARFVFFRLFAGTRHLGNNTIKGWAGWSAILAVTWIFAFIIAEVIPFFSDLLSLMSSLFDSFFGFIFWGVAYIRMRRADYGPGFWKQRGIRGIFGFVFNIVLCLIGLLFLTAGTYASVEGIVQGYASNSFGGPFTCKSNGLLG